MVMGYIDRSHVRSVHMHMVAIMQSLHSIQAKERLLVLYTLDSDFGFPHGPIYIMQGYHHHHHDVHVIYHISLGHIIEISGSHLLKRNLISFYFLKIKNLPHLCWHTLSFFFCYHASFR
jgi:hypothetical protein